MPTPPTPRRAASELHRLAAKLSLPPRVVSLSASILSATTPASCTDTYFAACAIYVALASSRAPPTLPLSALLAAAGGQLLITDFFRRAKLIAADASTLLPHPPPVNPAPLVHASHRAFMLSADLFRKLGDLFARPNLLHAADASATRAAWLLFLVAKAHLAPDPATPLPPVNALHLLLATLAESGLVIPSPPTSHLAAPTSAVPTEIDRYRALLLPGLPPSIRALLPLHGNDLSPMCHALDLEYAALLATSTHRLLPDERVFIDAPHLLSSPDTPPATPPTPRLASTHGPAGPPSPSHAHPPQPLRSPSRKRRMPLPPALAQTPRTRADLLREKMALTPRPSRFSRFIRPARGADALDALAAVASSAPHSPAVPAAPAPRVRIPPSTPMSAGCAAVAWLHRLADARPETNDELHCLTCPPDQVKPTDSLKEVVKDPARWVEIVQFVRNLSDQLAKAVPHLAGVERKREALAVFFASLENILVKEAQRLKNKPGWIVDNLVKATSMHKSILLCSWEVTSAAYGRRDLTVFTAAITAFEEPPLDFVKAIESFVLLPDMPRQLASHIMICGNRVLEAMAWKADSKLVKDLRKRALEKADENSKAAAVSMPAKDSNSNDPESTVTDAGDTCSERAEAPVPQNAVREFTLEYFFRRLLSVASERAQELLIRLGMDAIAEPVWASIKYGVWERWHLMVDRHLDQVIMCCVYGVAKVRRYELKFREIIQAYQTMSHVREPSFSHMVPGVFRDVSLESHLNLMPAAEESAASVQRASKTTEGKPMRGDIIKLYNQVFIHAMKAYILQFQVHAGHIASGVMSVRNLVGPGTSSAEALQRSSMGYPASATNSVLSGGPGSSESSRLMSGDRRDTLNEKVMSSPMRMLRPHASPRRIGRVTVSPMSPGGRSLVAIRQSPGRRAAGSSIMTPGTRKMYAFGESPVKSLDNINQTLAQNNSGSMYEGGRGKIRRSVPLDFEGNGVGQRKASMRKIVENVGLPRKSLRSQVGVRFASTSDRSKSGVDARSNGIADGSSKTSTIVRSPAN